MKPRLAALVLAAAGRVTEAAGGHFDVDDATILDSGHCQVEVWVLGGQAPTQSAAHLGPACRAGAAEWGLNLDRYASGGQKSGTLGAQVKWVADPAARRVSAGAVVSLARRVEGAGSTLAGAYLPVTWWLGTEGQSQLHLNLGRDRDPSAGPSTRRWGVALDQLLSDAWTFTAERRGLGGVSLTRVGFRYNLDPLLSIDGSWAQGGRSRVWAVGLNREWER